jgi:hypothetical protein
MNLKVSTGNYFRSGKCGMTHNDYGLAMVGHLKNVSSTFAQKPNNSTNVEFTTVCPTIAKPMLCVRTFS